MLDAPVGVAPFADAVDVAPLADALETMSEACEGEMVVVDDPVLLVSLPLLLLLLVLLLPLELSPPLLLPVTASASSASGLLSMNAMVGPATTLPRNLSRALLFSGCVSFVT